MVKLNLEILKDKNALIMFISQVISSVCEKMLSLGLIWFITKKFGANVVPWFLVFAFLPHLLLSFVSAKIIKKIGIINSIWSSTLFRSIIFLLAYLFITYILKDEAYLKTIIFTMVFFTGVASSIFYTGYIIGSSDISRGG